MGGLTGEEECWLPSLEQPRGVVGMLANWLIGLLGTNLILSESLAQQLQYNALN